MRRYPPTPIMARHYRSRASDFMVAVLLGALVMASAAVTTACAAPPDDSALNAPDSLRPTLSVEDRDALGRVAYAEAGNQREEGLAAVVHAVLNRVASGRFGVGVQGVLDAPGQFEPVARAGGRWRNLPPLSDSRRLVFNTILDLILQGRLPDLTGGSAYFQNPAIVAQRAAAGLVSPDLVNFGGQVPTAVIRDHVFFRTAPRRADLGRATLVRPAMAQISGTVIPAPPEPQAKFIRIGAAAREAGARIRIVRGAQP